MSKTIQHYHNSSLFISIAEAKEIIVDLTRDIKDLRSYYKCNPEYFTEYFRKKQKEEKEVNIQHELCYYETLILRSQEETQSIKIEASDYGLAHIEVSNNNFYAAREHLDDKDPIKIKITQIIKLMTEVEAELQAKL